ncbi:MAG: ferredoxin--NADP reductase [Myxococcales bacterium]|nr:ferredoxin--NADP reductase [Myxococcales bacterium]
MSNADDWQTLRLSARQDWAESLATFSWDGFDAPFASGQYVTLAKPIDGHLIERHYSIASPSGVPLALYLTIVPDGELTPHLFSMRVGDEVLCRPKPKGKFTLEKVPDARDLWMFATGTGLAPFLSMIEHGDCFRRFDNVILVHSVRFAADLGYRDALMARADRQPGFVYVPATSRQETPGALHGRVTTALQTGALEAMAEFTLSPEHSQVMMCGNPGMLGEMKRLLAERKMPMHRRFSPGNVHMEKYW